MLVMPPVECRVAGLPRLEEDVVVRGGAVRAEPVLVRAGEDDVHDLPGPLPLRVGAPPQATRGPPAQVVQHAQDVGPRVLRAQRLEGGLGHLQRVAQLVAQQLRECCLEALPGNLGKEGGVHGRG